MILHYGLNPDFDPLMLFYPNFFGVMTVEWKAQKTVIVCRLQTMVESKKKKKNILSHHIRHKTSFTNWPWQLSKISPQQSAMVPPWPIFDNAENLSLRHTKFVCAFSLVTKKNQNRHISH